MTGRYRDAVAALVTAVPDHAAGRDAIWEWCENLDAARAPLLTVAGFEAEVSRLAWTRLRAQSAFWQEHGAASLTQAMTSFLAGSLARGSVVGVLAQASSRGLSLYLAADGLPSAGLGALAASCFPGAELVDGHSQDEIHRLQAALSQHPARVSVSGGQGLDAAVPVSLIERLWATRSREWNLKVLMFPAEREPLSERYARLAHLRAFFAAQAAHQVVIDELTTAERDDPVARSLLEIIEAQQHKTRTALHRGGMVCAAVLAAPDPATLDVLSAAAVAATPPSETGSRSWQTSACEDNWVPGGFLTCGEAAHLVLPPLHDVHGLPCRSWARFDEHPEPFRANGPTLQLGRTRLGAPVAIPADALLTHALVTGNTGAGKSTFLFWLLESMHAKGVAYLVVEPTKTDYLRAGLSGVRHWAVGNPASGGWYLNPLEVPDHITIQSHVERLVALFRASFAMADPMPYVLEAALQQLYAERGWDLSSDSDPLALGGVKTPWPTVSDLVDTATRLSGSLGYPLDVERTLIGAFRSRLGSLTRGPKGTTIDTNRTLDIVALLQTPVVVNLDLIGDDEAKAFLMGLLLLRLAEARHGQHSDTLLHVTVIEEAHRLLRRDAKVTSKAETFTSNSTGYVSETIANMLAEVRSSGEGLIVVDQSPSQLAQAAVANTATKIAFRSTETDDKTVLAASMNLDDRQSAALTALGRHQAAVWWEGMDRPILARMQHRFAPPSAPPAYHRPTAQRIPATPQTASAIRQLVRTRPDKAGPIRSHLEQLLVKTIGHAEPAALTGCVRHLIESEIDSLGRSRQWTTTIRERALTAVIDNSSTPDHPYWLLLDGTHKTLGCQAVCTAGGCLLGEAIQPAAERVHQDPRIGLRTLLGSPEERKRRLRRELLAVFGEVPDPQLHRLAIGCLDAHLFDPLVDPPTIADLIQEDLT